MGRFGPLLNYYCQTHAPAKWRPPRCCVLCGWRAISRAKHLCWVCSTSPAGKKVPARVHSCTNRKGARADFNGTPPPAPEATEAVPGSEEKIVVLQARVAAGVQPYHPRDRRIDLS